MGEANEFVFNILHSAFKNRRRPDFCDLFPPETLGNPDEVAHDEVNFSEAKFKTEAFRFEKPISDIDAYALDYLFHHFTIEGMRYYMPKIVEAYLMRYSITNKWNLDQSIGGMMMDGQRDKIDEKFQGVISGYTQEEKYSLGVAIMFLSYESDGDIGLVLDTLSCLFER